MKTSLVVLAVLLTLPVAPAWAQDPPCTNGDCPPDDPPCTNGDCPPDDPPCTNGDCPPDDPPCTNGDCPPDDPPCTNGDCPPDDPPCTNGDCPPEYPEAAKGFYAFAEVVTACDLILIDTAAGTTTVIGSTDTSPEGLAFGPDRILYATYDSRNPCSLHASADSLATVNPATAEVTPIGPIISTESIEPAFDDVDSLAFAPDGTLFAVAVAGHKLITIDPATGAGTLVDDLQSSSGWVFNFVGAIEFLRDGRLIGADMADASGGPTTLLNIDPVTADATEIGGVGWESVEGMSLSSRGELFGMAGSLDFNPGTLIEINAISGQGSFVQQVQEISLDPYPPLDGLAALKSDLVEIDIKPGGYPNCFNANGHGVIPVAILGSDIFDVTQIDFDSLVFEGLEVRVRGRGRPLCAFEYSNDDGYLDLVCHFEDEDGAWTGGDSVAWVSGELYDGTWFEGYDSICIVP